MNYSFPEYDPNELAEFLALPDITPFSSAHSLLIFSYQKEISLFFGRQVFDLLLGASTADYSTARAEFHHLIQQWKKQNQPDFCSTRVRSSFLPLLHSLLSEGFYPVETLLHLFYPIPPSLVLTDELSSDILPFTEADVEGVMKLLRENRIITHIHLDPHLPPVLGDLALEYFVSRQVGKPGSVVGKRRGEIVGFFSLAPRQVPYPGKPSVLELLIGVLSRNVPARYKIAFDLLTVLYPRLAQNKKWLEIRIPEHLFTEATELLQQAPVHLETSLVLHYLKGNRD
ncbi:MAG: hypothetical protein ACK4G3_02435, partial [bacterium]